MIGSLSTIKNQNASITMSSREIAQLCEKRHDNVLKLVRDLVDGGVLKNTTPHKYQYNQNNQFYTEYLSDKRDSLVIVARLSPEFTAAIVDRWQELEEKQLNKNFSIPQTLSQALRLAAEQAEQIEQQSKLIAYQAPKVAFVEHYVEVGSTKSLREVAKILKMPEKAMISRLIEDKFLYRQSGNLLPYQSAHSRDLFAVKTGTAEHGHNFTQTRVTSKGIELIASRYASELMQ